MAMPLPELTWGGAVTRFAPDFAPHTGGECSTEVSLHEGSGRGQRVVDFNVKIRVRADGSGVELANVKMSMNPFDEIGVEEAISSRKRARRARSSRCRSAPPRRRGDDPHRARHGCRPRHPRQERDDYVEPWASQDPQGRNRSGETELVILGKQAIDDDCNQTGQMLAALLGWSQATFARSSKSRAAKRRSRARSMAALQTIKSRCRSS